MCLAPALSRDNAPCPAVYKYFFLCNIYFILIFFLDNRASPRVSTTGTWTLSTCLPPYSTLIWIYSAPMFCDADDLTLGFSLSLLSDLLNGFNELRLAWFIRAPVTSTHFLALDGKHGDHLQELRNLLTAEWDVAVQIAAGRTQIPWRLHGRQQQPQGQV